ncbi:MAG TPA: MOSC N-terminal beta barrel domain-containing protein [Candidatus Dormibacteraeota bacterium]|nr:MOSC N-terminal beta barrel domain-containing protein [Candidatus Dormibacteraeota bacterium]
MAIVGRVLEVWRYPVKSMGGESLPRAVVGPLGIAGDRGWALRDEAAGEIRGAKKMPVLMRCAARYDAEPALGASPPVTMTLPDGSTVHSGDADAGERLSALTGRRLTLWPLQPAERADHYRRGLPDDPDFDTELRQIFGRLPDEPLPDLSVLPPELFEFTSPLGTYFDLAPMHLLTTASLATLAARTPGACFDRRRFRPNLLLEAAGGASGLVENDWCGRTLRIGGAAFAITIPAMRCSMTTQAVDELPKDPSVLRTIVRDANQNLGVYANVAEAGAVAVGDAVELI